MKRSQSHPAAKVRRDVERHLVQHSLGKEALPKLSDRLASENLKWGGLCHIPGAALQWISALRAKIFWSLDTSTWTIFATPFPTHGPQLSHGSIKEDSEIPQCVLGVRVEAPVPRNTAGWDSGHKAAGAELDVFATWRLSGVEWAVRPLEELFTEDEVLFSFRGVFSPSVSVSDSSWSLSSSSSSSSDPSVSDSELLSDSV